MFAHRLRGLSIATAMAAVSCTMLNPAFETGDEGASAESQGETKADGTFESGSGVSSVTSTTDDTQGSSEVSSTTDDTQGSSEVSSTTDDSTSSTTEMTTAVSTSTTASSTTGVMDMGTDTCTLPLDEPLRFKVLGDFTGEPCPGEFRTDVQVIGPGPNNGIEALLCNEACGTCGPGSVELEAYPHDLSAVGAGTSGACLSVRYEVLGSGSDTVCEYGRAIVSNYADTLDETPVVIGSSIDGVTQTFATTFFADGELSPLELVEAETCDCNMPEPCCMPTNPPSIYGFILGSVGTVYPSGSSLFAVQGLGYNFYLYQAQLADSCSADLETSWLAIPTGG